MVVNGARKLRAKVKSCSNVLAGISTAECAMTRSQSILRSRPSMPWEATSTKTFHGSIGTDSGGRGAPSFVVLVRRERSAFWLNKRGSDLKAKC